MKPKHTVLLLTFLLLAPAVGFTSGDHGMDHGKKEMNHGKKAMDHGDMKGMDHQGMSMEGKMFMLGTHEVDGVKGMAHINDVREQMAKHDMKQTHHIMIAFEDITSGDKIESGTVAVKIEDPDEQVTDPVKMIGMDGHFGVDITLDKKGMYHFKIGTKLTDGKKRTFHHHFENM